MALIISGVGKIKAAASVSYLAALLGHSEPVAWLNIGIGGCKDVEVGTGLLAHKVTDQSTGKANFPSIVFAPPCTTGSIVTVDHPEKNHQQGNVYDMEAFGFTQAASLFSSAECVHAYKIVSDCDEEGMKHVTHQFVSSLVQDRMGEIESLIKVLQKLLPIPSIDERLYREILSHWHFTSSQQHQLMRCLQKWNACGGGELLAIDTFQHLKTGKEVIHHINNAINQTPLSFG